jgi:hypothetical protein
MDSAGARIWVQITSTYLLHNCSNFDQPFLFQAKGLLNPPASIVSWIKHGRLLERPERMRPDLFADEFWRWWISLNEPARTRSPTGRLPPIAQGESIQTDHLRAPGKNGWLSVLFSLLIWREWLGNGNTGDWDAAVADVRSVTIQLCNSIYYDPRARVPVGAKR